MSASDKGFQIRKLRSDDDVQKVAELIHKTDSLIYPFLYSDYRDKKWITLIKSCLNDKDNLFYIGNIAVIVFNRKIIGLINVVPCSVWHTFAHGEITETEAYQNYFVPLIEEIQKLDGCYLCNICIDENHRNRGLGRTLLNRALSEYKCNFYTDAISNNTPAIKTYIKNGFVPTENYMGYSGKNTEGIECTKFFRASPALKVISCPTCSYNFMFNEAFIPGDIKYDTKCPHYSCVLSRKNPIKSYPKTNLV